MKLFIDTNVVVDFLGKREPFFENAAIIFEMMRQGKTEAIVSSLTIVNCAYILRKSFSNETMLEKIDDLCQLLGVSSINKSVILDAIACKLTDFEDAVQYYSAQLYQPDVIITRDKTGFASFVLPVMTPAEFVAECRR